MNSKNMYWPDYIVIGAGLGIYSFVPSVDGVLCFLAISYSIAFQAILFFQMYSNRESIKNKMFQSSKIEYWYLSFISLCYFCLNIGPWSHILNFEWEPGEGAFALLFMGLGLQALRFFYDEVMDDHQNEVVHIVEEEHSFDEAA